jgi:hypothetical protein
MSAVTPEQINAFVAAEFPASATRRTEVGEGWAVALLEVQPSGTYVRPRIQ